MSTPPPPTAPAPGRPGGLEWWAPFVALLAAYGVALVLVAILAGATGNTDGDLPPAITLIATFLQDLLLIGAMIGFATLTAGRVSPATFGLRRLDRGEGWRAAGYGAAMLVAFFVFVYYWSKLDPGTSDDLAKDLGADESTVALVAVAILVALVAPVVEELFFRGFLFGALRRRHALDPGGAGGGRRVRRHPRGRHARRSSSSRSPCWASGCASCTGGRVRCCRASPCTRSTTRSPSAPA